MTRTAGTWKFVLRYFKRLLFKLTHTWFAMGVVRCLLVQAVAINASFPSNDVMYMGASMVKWTKKVPGKLKP
jgi:hypothetical protein